MIGSRSWEKGGFILYSQAPNYRSFYRVHVKYDFDFSRAFLHLDFNTVLDVEEFLNDFNVKYTPEYLLDVVQAKDDKNSTNVADDVLCYYRKYDWEVDVTIQITQIFKVTETKLSEALIREVAKAERENDADN